MDHPAIVEGNVAVITGGASGIGLAVAEKLARKGMRICLADLDQSALDAATAKLRSESIGVVADVSDRTAVEAVRDTVLSGFGRVDLLMNTPWHAGLWRGDACPE